MHLDTSTSHSHSQLQPYVGRFAPSPSGPLHLGSLTAALASYLDAKHYQGTWLVRIEDLDPPREIPGSKEHILKTLDRFGLEPDAEILYQSQRLDSYYKSLSQLHDQGLLFACDCTRRALLASSKTHQGKCLSTLQDKLIPSPDNHGHAIRILASDMTFSFQDRCQGEVSQNLLQDVGDFVLRRKDGLIAYQLAVVVDDAFQGITHSVRGADLISSTTRQIYLQEQLKLPLLSYLHFPVITDDHGNKLSKQHFSPSVDAYLPETALHIALRCLGQKTPIPPQKGALKEMLDSAIEHWHPQSIQATDNIQETALHSSL